MKGFKRGKKYASRVLAIFVSGMLAFTVPDRHSFVYAEEMAPADVTGQSETGVDNTDQGFENQEETAPGIGNTGGGSAPEAENPGKENTPEAGKPGSEDTSEAGNQEFWGNPEKEKNKNAQEGNEQKQEAEISTMASNSDIGLFDIREGNITINDGDTVGTFQVNYGYNQAVTLDASRQITVTSEGVRTRNIIVIAATKSQVKLKISNVKIKTPTPTSEANSKNAIAVLAGSSLDLKLEGENTLEGTGWKAAALYVPADAALQIGGEGLLKVTAEGYIQPSGNGYAAAAAIGGASKDSSRQSDSGTIIINSGTITASGDSGCGIGAGSGGIAHKIIINGGTVTATSRMTSAGIGGGAFFGTANRSAEQNITINGGRILARSVSGAAAIGGGWHSQGGNITITGGFVEVPESRGENAIGAGQEITTAGVDRFSTGGIGSGTNFGNAVIFLAKRSNGSGGFISDQSDVDNWGGIIFQANEGKVYGQPNITESFTIPADYRLTMEEGQTVINETAITVTIDGVIVNRGTFSGRAAFITNGTFENYGTFINRGRVEVAPGGKVYNGSEDNIGMAEIRNEARSSVQVDGNIYNYSKITGSVTPSGSGNIYHLSSMKVTLEKNGHPVSAENPVHYQDEITVKLNVAHGPYMDFPTWSPENVSVQFKLWNGDTEADLGQVLTEQRSTDGTVEFSGNVKVDRTDLAPWEGGKVLKVGASMDFVGGLQGYLKGAASADVQYDKLPIDMGGVKWNETSYEYNGTPRTVRLINLPSGVTAAYTDNEKTEPGIYKAMPVLVYENFNHALTNMSHEVETSLTEGHSWEIKKVVPTVTSWPVAADLTEGQRLSESALSGGASNVPGLFAWKNPAQEVVWGQSSMEYDVVFTPTDSAHYTTVEGEVAVKVNPIYFNVTLNLRGGTITGDTVIQVQKGTLIRPKPADPSYPDTSFAGWYKDESCTTLWDFERDRVPGDLTLYAKYTLNSPAMLIAIPNEVVMINDSTKGAAEGTGTVTVKPITDPNVDYPDKVLKVSTDPKVILTGENEGSKYEVQVYKEDNTVYQGGTLMVFDFSTALTESKGFGLKVPMDFEKPSDTYKGTMSFQLELTPH